MGRRRDDGVRGLLGLLALALAGLGACSPRVARPADAVAEHPQGKDKPMTADELRARVLTALDDDGLDPSEITVGVVDDITVAGATFFEVELEGGGPGQYVPGVALGDEVMFGREVALPRLLRTLGRNAAPAQVAAVAGFLEATGDRTRAVLSAADAEDFKPAWRTHVTLPSVVALADGARRSSFCSPTPTPPRAAGASAIPAAGCGAWPSAPRRGRSACTATSTG